MYEVNYHESKFNEHLHIIIGDEHLRNVLKNFNNCEIKKTDEGNIIRYDTFHHPFQNKAIELFI